MTIDFDKLRLILLPHALRQGSLLEALFRTAYVPLKRNYAALVRFVGKEEQEREYGPTVKQLRQALADHLGIGESRIAFGEVEDRDVVSLWRKSAGKPQDVGQLTLWSDDQVWWNREFTVTLPSGYEAYEAEVKAILDRWKMAASRYTIKYRTNA